MDYTIKKHSALQQFFHKAKSKIEDIFLAAVLIIANLTNSEKLSNWLKAYTEKKIQKMQADIIKMRWDKVTLDKAVSSIHEKQ